MVTLIGIAFLAVTVAAVHADDSFNFEDQAIWIDRLNYFRTTGLPWPARNMHRIGWNPDLATTAASTAAKCSATTPAGVNVYQSSSKNSSSIIDEAIQQWVVETSMTTLKTLTQPGASGVEIGKGTYNSYSQILWAATTSVGCASASCSGGEMVVCEFSPVGNDGSSAWYVHGNAASDCPSGTTGSQGLCIVEGDIANNPIAPIPAGKLTYEVYPAYVANIHTVLIEAARGIASGEMQTAPTVPTAATTAAPTATTAAPTSLSSKTSSNSSNKDGSDTKTSTTDKTRSSSTSDYSSSSSEASSPLTETGATLTPTSKKISKTTTSSSGTNSSLDPSTEQTFKTTQPLPGEDSVLGTVKASSSTGSTFTNQETSTKQTSSSPNSASSAGNDDTTTASTPTPDSGTVAGITNKSSKSPVTGISVAGIAGMIVLAIVGVAAFGVVVSYKRNQRRQREIMRDGGIRII